MSTCGRRVKHATGAKVGFCFWDTTAVNLSLPGAPAVAGLPGGDVRPRDRAHEPGGDLHRVGRQVQVVASVPVGRRHRPPGRRVPHPGDRRCAEPLRRELRYEQLHVCAASNGRGGVDGQRARLGVEVHERLERDGACGGHRMGARDRPQLGLRGRPLLPERSGDSGRSRDLARPRLRPANHDERLLLGRRDVAQRGRHQQARRRGTDERLRRRHLLPDAGS